MKPHLLRSTLAILALPLTALTAAPTADTATRLIVEVDAATQALEAKSLNPDPGLAQRVGAASPNHAGIMKNQREPNPAPMADMEEELPSAATYYKITIAPGETLSVKLNCEQHGKVYLQFLPPPHPSATMAAQFRQANIPPRSSRSSAITFKNPTPEGYVVMLALYGQANYSYRLEFQRQGATQATAVK